MYPIWNLIIEWLRTRNIILTLVKVKGHSDDALNQHADELARQGLTSPAFVVSPNDIRFNTRALAAFRNRSSTTILEVDARGFIQNTQQAILFDQILSLKRFTSILPLHDSVSINWDCTLFCLQYDMLTPSQQTSFAQNRTFTWATKLFLDELPLLATLQKRRPDLYQADWNCVSCNLAPETWSHLWNCPTIMPKLTGLTYSTKLCLINLLFANSSALTPINHIDIDNMSCWQMTPSSNDTLRFDLLIRGFIPLSLHNVIHSIVKTKEQTRLTIANLIFIAQQILKKEIWKDRNTAMIAFEKEHNISPAEKNKPSYATRRSTTTIDSSFLSTPRKR